ncbi:hydrogenase (NiFe) small subunit HydA [Desulfarculus baarsii DSM 2075]|uniref:Hydrogenase (NiFe) small subunit HydA n=1 Tax=Desulfarculus baarsii (strain ATCC 33931 / DSM 2075 / LMG 7858 / VKM B-1802 / 2st14) TaxID=644282 RepID=E1QGS5_DESB2|nr:hydrogenase small subunit [Desulfarculus baarsii]ADK84768.1 hydrogenase (NiFe) small subunit HydA [Desulfarculus baarsii DSM 2075]
MDKLDHVLEHIDSKGINRRDFIKLTTLVTSVLGLAPAMIPKVAQAMTAKERPTVIWLHFAECTGCSEAFIRSSYPWIDELVLEVLNVAYHETIMAPAGHAAEKSLHEAMERYKGKYILVCEGGIPTADGGVWGKVAGRPMIEIAKEAAKGAVAVMAMGTCACYGGVQAAKPNPTKAMGVGEALGIQTINLAGCPPNPVNAVSAVVQFLLLGRTPALDDYGRPKFAYGATIHDKCPRRAHFEEAEFVKRFGDEGAINGWCLFEMGCKGPDTHNNCSLVKFNDGTNWPVGAGHPCLGCSEPQFWDNMAPFYTSKP